MAVFKCKLCGGTIEVKDNGIGVCDSCGTRQTIPNTNDEKKMNLLDRANHFRMQNDFDKAMSIYEQVLGEDTTDSDLYYSIALCRYGITYVDDPKTKKKIPTINRMQNVKFTEDADFIMAVKYAEPEQAKFYKEEGEYLDKVQQGIMDITKNEKPYDVFICYKETDDNGERTRDSVLANDLYHGLTNEGFKVFFARITLEGKLGVAYEPYIFAALQSSKVMVVLGTKKEYFNAVWVKNEWSRYISLMNEGANKTLIPAFRDMDPYDLPDEFSNLQALDMSKLGFMQDLIRGIKKIVVGTKETTPDKVDGSSDKVSSLLKRVKVFLDDGDFKKAKEYCEKALDINAEDSNVYLYETLIDYKCKNIDELIEKQIKTIESYDGIALGKKIESEYFNKALIFGNDSQKKSLENMNNECYYRIAKNQIDKKDYKKAKTILESIISYKDCKELSEKCDSLISAETLKNEENLKKRKENEIKVNNEILLIYSRIKKPLIYEIGYVVFIVFLIYSAYEFHFDIKLSCVIVCLASILLIIDLVKIINFKSLLSAKEKVIIFLEKILFLISTIQVIPYNISFLADTVSFQKKYDGSWLLRYKYEMRECSSFLFLVFSCIATILMLRRLFKYYKIRREILNNENKS